MKSVWIGKTGHFHHQCNIYLERLTFCLKVRSASADDEYDQCYPPRLPMSIPVENSYTQKTSWNLHREGTKFTTGEAWCPPVKIIGGLSNPSKSWFLIKINAQDSQKKYKKISNNIITIPSFTKQVWKLWEKSTYDYFWYFIHLKKWIFTFFFYIFSQIQ